MKRLVTAMRWLCVVVIMLTAGAALIYSGWGQQAAPAKEPLLLLGFEGPEGVKGWIGLKQVPGL